MVIAQSRNTMATQQTLNVDVKQYPGPQTAARHVNKVKCPGKFFDCQCRAGQCLYCADGACTCTRAFVTATWECARHGMMVAEAVACTARIVGCWAQVCDP